MNFLQIAQYLADQLDGDYPSTIFNADLGQLSQTVRRYRENINTAYNMVLLSLNRTNENRETITTFATVDGTESYNIPASLLVVDQLKIGTDPPLNLLPWPEYERFKSDTYLIVTTSGYPSIASFYQRKIWLYPTPDAAVTVTVRGQELMTELDADADEPDLPADFHRAIAELALYYEMDYEGNPRAGQLNVQENGSMQASGGQAARALAMLKLARNNSRNHAITAPRLVSPREKRYYNRSRQIIRA